MLAIADQFVDKLAAAGYKKDAEEIKRSINKGYKRKQEDQAAETSSYLGDEGIALFLLAGMLLRNLVVELTIFHIFAFAN